MIHHIFFIAFRCVFFFITGNMERITLRSLHQTIIHSLSAHSAVHLAVRWVGITSVLRLLAQSADFCFSTQLFEEKIYLSLSFQQENAPCACGKPQDKHGEGFIYFAMFVLLLLSTEPYDINASRVENVSDYVVH